MKNVRIYQPGEYSPGQTIELSPEAGQHVGVVLRMQPGEPLTLFSGDNREFTAQITSAHKKKVVVTILASCEVNRESPKAIHLAHSLSKGERMEWVVQKAVELGVTSITPILTERSVVRLDADRFAKKRLQWQAIAVSACEQSGRNTVPMIHELLSLDDYIQQCEAKIKLVLYPSSQQTWRDYSFDNGDMTLLIGPEGGLTESEIQQALANQFYPLSLGPRVLRTETAAITALGVLQAVCGDL